MIYIRFRQDSQMQQSSNLHLFIPMTSDLLRNVTIRDVNILNDISFIQLHLLSWVRPCKQENALEGTYNRLFYFKITKR